MAALRARYLIGGTLILGAVGYLGYAAGSDSWAYYRDVDAFVSAKPTAGTRARVHGRVDPNGADIRPVDLFAQFHIIGARERLAVEYRGPLPDLFVPGGQVVAEGVMDASGVFRAEVLLTKCASKYEGHGETVNMSRGGASR